MEKMGVVRPDITPQVEPTKSANCADPQIVDNKRHKIEELDADFRKQAATRATDSLNK
jgi:hypothetical protein